MSVVTPLADVLPSEALSFDEVGGPWVQHGASPEAVVHPESTEEVGAVLRWAAESGVAVVPAGSGRRLGGPWPEGPFLVLSTRRLAGVEVYEPADLTLTAGAGTGLADLDAALRAQRQWLPFDPPHVDDRTLGGLVATGASGPLWMGYGELRNHVLGMTVVTGDGRALALGGRVVKNVAGFDLLKPVVGSRGRLGVITSVCLRTFPVPAADRLLVLEGASLRELVHVSLAVGTAPVMPVSCSLLLPAPGLGDSPALLVRLHGAERTVAADQRAIEGQAGVTFRVADESTRVACRDHAWGGDVVTNVSVRPSRLADALAGIGDLPDMQLAVDTYAATARVSSGLIQVDDLERIREAVEALGGTVTVASGPPELTRAASSLSPAVRDLSARLERVFDPAGVLWRA